MSVQLPNGATISIASTYGTPTITTSVSNASEAVAALTSATGFSATGIVEVTSGWSRLNNRIARVKTLVSLNATLELIDTTNTTRFPAGSGVGSARPISAWTQITQVLEAATSGGDQQFATYAFLEDATERQIPTTKSAQSFAITIADDITLPHYAILAAADDDRLQRAIRIVLPSGSPLYYNCFVTLNKTPTLVKNEVMGLQVSFSLTADITRYAT